jgi:hypothetical protein
MADPKKFEFFLLRYVPDALKQEFVNIGVVLMARETGSTVLPKVRFTTDWRRVVCLFPDTDVDVLKSLTEEIAVQLTEARERDFLLKWLRESSSGSIQISEPQALLANEPEKEIEILNQMYLKSMASARTQLKLSKTEAIRLHMANSFKVAGVWRLLMKDIPVAPYTARGDPLTFDFGYRLGDTIKLFHAVSLKSSVDQAITLATRYPKIALSVAEITNAHTSLTAVVDDDLDRGRDEVTFALGEMEKGRIQVAVAAEMPLIAERARLDLRA